MDQSSAALAGGSGLGRGASRDVARGCGALLPLLVTVIDLDESVEVERQRFHRVAHLACGGGIGYLGLHLVRLGTARVMQPGRAGVGIRSEERRVGKAWRAVCWRPPYHSS